MTEFTLPRLAGTREALRDLIRQQDLPDDLSGQSVVVFCRELVSGSSSYADELVRQVLEVRGAREVLLVGSPPLFSQRVIDAAARRGRDGSVHTRTAAEVLT